MKRTNLQNNSMHLYQTQLAQAFNDEGLSVEKVLSKPLDMPWSKNLIMDLIWRVVQQSLYGTKSTTELSTIEISEIYEVINRFTAQEWGVSVPWPEEDSHLELTDER
jgi:hypothetical protein